RQVGDEILAQQEHVVSRRVGACLLRMIPVEGAGADRIERVKAQRVGAVVGQAGIEHVDQIGGLAAGDVNHIVVGTAAPIQIDSVEHGAVAAVGQQVVR